MLTHLIGQGVSALDGSARNVHSVPNCLVIQHVAAESAFSIADALVSAGIAITTCRTFAGDVPPSSVAALDGLVVMGGPMSADSDDGFATRQAELSCLMAALEAGIPVLGVCLGAQLLALAGGGRVRRGEGGPEIGWGAVELTADCSADPLFTGLPVSLEVLQWHGDTFDLPPGSVRLSQNAAYANQAFRVGSAAWGLQFHVEVDVEAVSGFLDAFGADADAVAGGRQAIRAATPAGVANLAPFRDQLLGRFAQLVVTGVSRGDLVGS
jgi:GMP synthase-like glutamine amidotransferase